MKNAFLATGGKPSRVGVSVGVKVIVVGFREGDSVETVGASVEVEGLVVGVADGDTVGARVLNDGAYVLEDGAFVVIVGAVVLEVGDVVPIVVCRGFNVNLLHSV